MGILWERRFVAIEPGGRGRARREEMRVSSRMQRLCRLGARCRTTADWSSHTDTATHRFSSHENTNASHSETSASFFFYCTFITTVNLKSLF